MMKDALAYQSYQSIQVNDGTETTNFEKPQRKIPFHPDWLKKAKETSTTLYKEHPIKFKNALIVWFTVLTFVIVGLYADYHYSLNVVVPKDSQYAIRVSLISGSNIVSGANDTFQCTSDTECGNGKCTIDKDIYGNIIGTHCTCDSNYITVGDNVCSYRLLSGFTALMLSIFPSLIGCCGIDRCYIARGNGCCICVGILKGLTLGGLGIWFIVDLVLISNGDLPDGNGYPLSPI